MVYLATFTTKTNQMWVNIPYMDPVGYNPFCKSPETFKVVLIFSRFSEGQMCGLS